jgi:hypothetical protein
MLTGRPPFHGSSTLETLDQVRYQEPVPLRRLVPKLPRDLDTIVLKCLEKNPSRRYGSAKALAYDLRRWLDNFPIRARPTSWSERTGRWCRRQPAMASLLAVLALTVTSSLLGLFALWRQSEAQRLRAEAARALAVENEQAAADAVRELMVLLTTTLNSPQMLASDRIDLSARVVSDLKTKMSKGQGLGDRELIAICDFERELSGDFRRRGKFAECRALLTETLALLEERSCRRAEGHDITFEYVIIFIYLGCTARDQECFEEALGYYRRAQEVLKGITEIRRVSRRSHRSAPRENRSPGCWSGGVSRRPADRFSSPISAC